MSELLNKKEAWSYDWWSEDKWRRCFVDNGQIRSGGWEIGIASTDNISLAIVNIDDSGVAYINHDYVAQWR